MCCLIHHDCLFIPISITTPLKITALVEYRWGLVIMTYPFLDLCKYRKSWIMKSMFLAP